MKPALATSASGGEATSAAVAACRFPDFNPKPVADLRVIDRKTRQLWRRRGSQLSAISRRAIEFRGERGSSPLINTTSLGHKLPEAKTENQS